MKKILLRIFLVILLISLTIGGLAAWYIYEMVFGNNTNSNNGNTHELYIPTNANYDQVLDSLRTNHILQNDWSFDQVAQQMNYPNKIYAGRYLIADTLNNRDLIVMLRRGEQVPFNVTIHNIRTKKDFVTYISKKLEPDAQAFSRLLNDSTFLASKGFTTDNILSVFMSDTYQFNWNTSAEQFLDRMLKEYTKFWTSERKAKAEQNNLSPYEVITLAAIVEEETAKKDEMNRIAGVYFNRLRKEWPLQADPTVKFAIGDFSIKRVLKRHLEFDSPYNTYKYAGLPPGPIRIPQKAAIRAVLNAEEHQYMYFCAKEDFSGYHNFAVTNREHMINARRYQKELNRRRIMK